MDLLQLLGIEPDDTCFMCGKIHHLSVIEQMGWEKFNIFVHINNPPCRLVRYFRYNEKTIANLQEGTVYLNDVENFDDCFDCAVDLDYNKFREERLKQYCRYFNVDITSIQEEMPHEIALKLLKFGTAQKAINEINNTLDNIQKLTIKHFVLYVFKNVDNSKDWVSAINTEIENEYENFKSMFKYFKMTCFTTSPYSNKMWATNDSRGFCVEYEINYSSELYASIFPVIYSQKRNDFFPLSRNSDKKPTVDDLWQIYFNGLLRKSVHWAEQNEWRLIEYQSDKKAKNISFFKPKKVYLGNKMKANDREVIIAICNEKHIPYVGIIRKTDSFDLVECSEDCLSCQLCRTK